jgi:hypothetical protein
LNVVEFPFLYVMRSVINVVALLYCFFIEIQKC